MAGKNFDFDDRELEMQIERVRRAAELDDLTQPRAVSARYEEESQRIVVELRSGAVFAFPVAIAQGISEGAAAELAEVELTSSPA